MRKTGKLMLYLLSFFMFFSLFSASAQAFDVSGAVNYSGAKTGRVYVKLQGNGQYGTSIAAAPGAFTIRGVQPGTYMLTAFMDVQGTGSRHKTDPSDVIINAVTVINGNISGADISIADPITVLPPANPAGFTVLPGENAALVMWGNGLSTTGEDAEKYDLYWGANPDPGTVSTPLGSILNIPATGEEGTVILTSLNQPTIASCSPTCYFSLVSKILGQTQTGLSKAMVTIGNPTTSGATVTGTVNYTGSSAPGVPLLLALVNATNNRPTQFYAGVVPSPTTGSNSFSITNVPDGTYELHALLDSNNNAIMDIGDLSSGNARNIVSVTGGAVSGQTAVIINDVNAEGSVRTNHWKDAASNESYNLNIEISGMKKRPVLVKLTGASNTSGPISYITGPVDVPLDEAWGGFYTWLNIGLNVPLIGDTYSFDVVYSDTTTGTITSTVTGVLNSFATPTAPVGNQSYSATPTFTWAAPVTTPTNPWVYTLYLNNQNGGGSWDSNWIPNTQTSETFANLFPSQPTLGDNTSYYWDINVSDIFGNSSSYGAGFSFGTPITPGPLSITTFSLPQGVLSTPYSQNLTATGGTQPYNWSFYSGTLPPGLVLSGNTISGTPTSAGFYTFDVQLQDGSSTTLIRTLSIDVLATAPAWVVYNANPTNKNDIDWLRTAHSLLPMGSFIKINGIYYYASGVGGPSYWNDPAIYWGNGFYDCNQTTGALLYDTAIPSQPLRPDLSGTAGMTIEYFATWPLATSSATFTSGVQDCSGSSCVNLAGVAITTVGLTPEVTATSDVNGLFSLTVPFTTTLNSVPATAKFYIKLSKSGFADTVSTRIQLTASNDSSNRPYSLYVPTQLTANWGNTSGKGIIRSRIVDNANLSTGYVGGAVVTATDQTSTSLPVVYLDAQGNVVSGSTATSGIYMVKNITPGSVVTVTASAPGFSTFQTRTFDILADTVSQGRISASSTIPIVYGNVSYAGSKTGRIYLSMDTNNGTLGTSIPGPGPFAIRGVPNGTWTLNAYRDAPGLGVQTASAPSGSVSVNMIGTTITGLNITLTDPVDAVPAAPTYVGASPGDSSVIIGWEPPRDANDKEAADSYDIYWGTSAAVSATVNSGSKNVPAGQDSPAIIDGLTNGQSLYFVVVAKRGASASAASTPFGPVVIGSVAGGHSVSGTVSITGGTAPTGPLYVAVVAPDSKGAGGIYFARIASPTFPQAFTVTGVPNGYYEVFAIVDANNDGVFSTGDLSATEDSVPKITVNGSDITGLNNFLAVRNASIEISTNHGQDQSGLNVWYNTNAMVRSELKRPVLVTLTGAPVNANLTLPMDIGLRSQSNEFDFWVGNSSRPNVGDTYTFDISYSDGSRQAGLTAAVTGVNDAFPTSVAVSSPTSTVPTFTWAAPTSPPTGVYNYSIWVGNNNNNIWDAWSIPSSKTQVVYNFDGRGGPLAVSTQYSANISTRDSKGNQASITLQFTPTQSAPADTTPPAISLSTPANGATGVPITTTLSVRFSEPIDNTTLPNMSAFLQSGATYVSGTGSYDAINDLYIFTPLAPLANSTTYTATFSGIKDLAGNTITTTTRTFTTEAGADITAPVTTASPAEGLYNADQTVTLTANEPATIYYTTNGATPTTTSAVYSTPISISATTTLRFFAKDTAGNSETVKTQIYTIDKTAPVTTPSPAAGTYGASLTVTLTASETATIYYTTDGIDPTTLSAVYSSPISISATTTLKYFAKDSAGNSETVKTAVYTIDTTIPVTTASPAGGLYNAAQSVTLTVNKTATVYYTTNGAVPTTSSPVYSGPIIISSTTTLQYFAKDVAGNSEAVQTAVYTIDTVKPTVTSTTPTALATGIAVDSAVTIAFSEDVKASTVNNTNIQLSTASAALTGTVAYNPASRTVTFTPSGLLPAGTVIYLSIANVEDMAGNKLTSVNRSFTTAFPDGDYNGDGAFTIADVNEILKAALLKNTPTAAQLSRADISPLVSGKPGPDGVIDVSDVVVSLRKLVGLVSW